MDGDGRLDIIVNEMTGNGVTIDDVGNLLVISGAALLGPPILYVDLDATGLGNGTNWDDAFTTIQAGIEVAHNGDTVLVAPGAYHEEINFLGKAITVASGADAAVIQGDGERSGVAFDQGEDPNSLLKNFVIAHCTAGILVSGASPVIEHVTVVKNTVGLRAGPSDEPLIRDSIFWDNDDDLLDAIAAYSCIEDGDAGPGNLSSEPLFSDSNQGDYHLQSVRGRFEPVDPNEPGLGLWNLDDLETSPCVDAADPIIHPSNKRMPNGGRANMGAFGNTRFASLSDWPLPADSNRDGVVDILDLFQLANDWLQMLGWIE